jgi:hypothetical protein
MNFVKYLNFNITNKNSKLNFLKIILALCSIYNSGCSDFIKGEHKVIKSNDSSSLSLPEFPDFQDIKLQILDKHCIQCHTGRHKAYEMYEVVKLSANEMLSRMKTTNTLKRMPQNLSPLDPNLIRLFQDWVDQGAPQFSTSSTPDNPKDDSTVKYSFADIKEFIFKPNNCLECHSHYDDYKSVFRSISSIASTLETDRMPYPKSKADDVKPATQDQKKIFLDWIKQGAPKFVNETSTVVDDPLVPNWFSIRNQILGPKCILCHNSFGKRGPKDMSTYKSMQAWSQSNPELFNSTNPLNSHFIGAILGRVDDDEFFYDAMPFKSSLDDVQDLPDVTDQEFAVLIEWIRLGLPEQ